MRLTGLSETRSPVSIRPIVSSPALLRRIMLRHTLCPVLVSVLAVTVAAEQCYSTVNSILATGQAISPTTVLLQLEYTQQSVASGAVSVSDAISSACAGASDPALASFCSGYRSSTNAASITTQATVGTLNVLINCFQAYINGAPDYELSAGSYFAFNGGGGPPIPQPSPNATPGKRRRTSVYRTLASFDTRLDFSTCRVKTPFSGLLTERQQTSCSTVVTCYTTCRSCQARDALCTNTVGAAAVAAGCGFLGNVVGSTLGTIAVDAACLPLAGLCGPVALGCLSACITVMPQAVNALTTFGCAASAIAACNFATSQCAQCNVANNDICNPNTSRCCPTETGTSCGIDCCCCGYGLAPRGANCACVPTP